MVVVYYSKYCGLFRYLPRFPLHHTTTVVSQYVLTMKYTTGEKAKGNPSMSLNIRPLQLCLAGAPRRRRVIIGG